MREICEVYTSLAMIFEKSQRLCVASGQLWYIWTRSNPSNHFDLCGMDFLTKNFHKKTITTSGIASNLGIAWARVPVSILGSCQSHLRNGIALTLSSVQVLFHPSPCACNFLHYSGFDSLPATIAFTHTFIKCTLQFQLRKFCIQLFLVNIWTYCINKIDILLFLNVQAVLFCFSIYL